MQRLLFQPEALAVIFGGLAIVLLVSFPARLRAGALRSVLDLARRRTSPIDGLVPVFVRLAFTARRQGWAAVESEIARLQDPFLARALTLSVSGLEPDVVRETLEVEARVKAEREDTHATVIDTAARCAPALGLIAGLGVLTPLVDSGAWTTVVSHGLAAAIVAVVYGVVLASLVLQPLAARLRARAREDARRRAMTIHGVAALREGAAPSVVEERLAGYLSRDRRTLADVA